ncbi:MAG: hypothetical protein E7G24_16580, partial [Clostridium celatum]|nr:hypothetical protein [Clostridium celatum]
SLNLKNRRVPDRYARWCERTENKIIIFLLLDLKRENSVKIIGFENNKLEVKKYECYKKEW